MGNSKSKDMERGRLALALWGARYASMKRCEEVADGLIEKGFRDQRDVAREIFAEVEKIVGATSFFWAQNAVADLKVKYTGGEVRT